MNSVVREASERVGRRADVNFGLVRFAEFDGARDQAFEFRVRDS